MRKLVFYLYFLSTIASFVFPPNASAKRLLPRVAPKKTAYSKQRVVSSRSRGVTIRVKFRSDRRGIIATFSNTKIARRIDYALTYSSQGKPEGIVGTIAPSEEKAMREILFGTCSAGVCRYHSQITNARFKVTTTLKNGVRVIKPFRLRV